MTGIEATAATCDLTDLLQERVRCAAAERTPLQIVGGGTKAFYGRAPRGEVLAVAGHRGVVAYEPTELVVTARAGTPLAEIETLLAQHGQMLAFEPPHFGAAATVGGCVACGLSGPRRPYAGAVRDHLLGIRLLNGRGEVLRFGGEVMKNVAGYDVSRLMAGALGTLGVLLEVSLKVVPRPAREETLRRPCNTVQAIETMNRWAASPVPLSGAAFDGEQLYLRLSGTQSGVGKARGLIGGDVLPDAGTFWERLREHRHGFFDTSAPFWRLSVRPGSPPIDLPGKWLHRLGRRPALAVRAAWGRAGQGRGRERAGGHATLFRGGDRAARCSSRSRRRCCACTAT